MGKKKKRTNWKKKYQETSLELKQANKYIERLDELLPKKRNRFQSFLYEVLPIIVSIVVGVFIFFQTKLMSKQTELLGKQNLIIDTQTKLQDEQTNMMKKQNDILENQYNLGKEQNILFNAQNELVQIQNKQAETQNTLVNYQNSLIKIQSNRMNQQTELQEAERRSSLVYLFSNVLDKIDEELKQSSNQKRELSEELISRIASLTQALKPYKYLRNDSIISTAVSPEKGQLLLALINFKLDSITYQRIFSISNFKNTEITSGVFNDAIFEDIDLSGSRITFTDFSKATFKNAILDNAVLNHNILNGTTFYNSSLNKTDLSKSYGVKTKFIRVDLLGTLFNNSTLREAQFDSGHKYKYDFGKILFGNYDCNKPNSENIEKIRTVEEFSLIFDGCLKLTLTNNETKKAEQFYISPLLNIDMGIVPDGEGRFKSTKLFRSSTNRMIDVDFTNTDLSGSVFSNIVLDNVKMFRSLLGGCEFKNVLISNTYFEKSFINESTYQNNFNSKSNLINIGDFYKLMPADSIIHYQNLRENVDSPLRGISKLFVTKRIEESKDMMILKSKYDESIIPSNVPYK